MLNRILYSTLLKVSYNPLRFATHPEEYLVPYFTKRGDGPLGAMSGFEAIGNVR